MKTQKTLHPDIELNIKVSLNPTYGYCIYNFPSLFLVGILSEFL